VTDCGLFLLVESDGTQTPYVGVTDEAGREYDLPLADFLVLTALREIDPDVLDRLVGLAGLIVEKSGLGGLEA